MNDGERVQMLITWTRTLGGSSGRSEREGHRVNKLLTPSHPITDSIIPKSSHSAQRSRLPLRNLLVNFLESSSAELHGLFWRDPELPSTGRADLYRKRKYAGVDAKTTSSEVD
jgi:hypothetical protein